MNRRHFLSSLSAAAVAPLASPQEVHAPAASSRSQVSLSGTWQRYVLGAAVDTVEVPSSLRPSGYYQLRRSFVIPKPGPAQRVIAHFDAVNFHGRVFVNKTEAGTTLPYVPAEFDITKLVREGTNTMEVAIADLCAEPGGAGADEVWLGVNPGWEAYGGIIRPTYVELRPAAFVDNVRFAYKLNAASSAASCQMTAFLSSDALRQGELKVVLRRGKTEIARSSKAVRLDAGATEVDLGFEVHDVALWSPATPNLYECVVTLTTSALMDAYRFRTGFRHVGIRGRRYELNGAPIVLNGVCRHDMWKDQGFTLTRAQMEQDMRGIKALGANYVRLVHYPHDRYIVELCDELGLLVSEEPGFWGMNFATMPWSRAELGLKILERTIRRDWNSPSVFLWLLGNESRFSVEYLRRGKDLCRSLDPLGRAVSIANSMRKEDAKPLFDAGGLDSYDDHPYTFAIDEFDKIAEFYGPHKPLIFTEWGGKEIGQSEIIMPNTVDKLLDMTEGGVLAGHAFWSWQDLPQFTRIDPEMRDGILESGVVTEGREPRNFVYAELGRLLTGRRHTGLAASDAPVPVPLRRAPWSPRSRFEPVDLSALVSSDPARRAWAEFERHMEKYWSTHAAGQWERSGRRFALWKTDGMDILGVRFATPLIDGYARPLVVTPESPEIEIPASGPYLRLHFLGHVTAPGGHPVEGAVGDTAASYTVRYTAGRTVEVPLRNGIEIAAGNIIDGATRIDPVATSAQRAFWFAKDWAREQYQGLLFSLPVDGTVANVLFRLHGNQPVLLFAVTAESD